MKNLSTAVLATALIMTACTQENPLLSESKLPYGAPQFDKIKTEHYLPAIKEGIAQAKANTDAIIRNEAEPTFENTIEALENSSETLGRVLGIFFNLLEADTNDTLQQIAEEATPLLNDFEMYVSLNDTLFQKIKYVYDRRENLNLDKDQLRLLEKNYESFLLNGALLSPEDKKVYSNLQEQLSLATLRFGRNVLAATNAYTLNITDEKDLAGLPDYLLEQGRECAQQHGHQGWTFDLSYPSYGPFMRFCENRELRHTMYMAYNSRAFGGEFDNCGTVKEIVELRLKIANILGFETYADYALKQRMLKTPAQVNNFLSELLLASLPAAKQDIKAVFDYASANGFEDSELQAWDFSYWSEKYKNANYNLSESELKPYFKLDNCIAAIFDLANRLYGITFEQRKDIPVYHKDVRVYDVKDADGRHLALFYADFFPRPSKRGGAWMTEFRGQKIVDGVEQRPFISLVTNFTKPTASSPSLITHDEMETLLHEFGHSLHGILSEGRYESLATTNVARDFVELPSQIMENWDYEPEFLQTFAKHYQTGEVIPQDLIDKIVAAKKFNAAYSQVRQLNFGILDMAWYGQKKMSNDSVAEFERNATLISNLFPEVEGSCISTSFSHIFSGGYSAGYYSYKWSEVLEADAFSLFKEKGIFNREVAKSFRDNILSRGGSDDEAVLYRNFRGRDPEVKALLEKTGIKVNR